MMNSSAKILHPDAGTPEADPLTSDSDKVFKKFMFDQVFVSDQERVHQSACQFTEEDLQAAKILSDQEGYQRGLQESQTGLLSQCGQMLNRRLDEFVQAQRRQEELLHQQVAHLAQEMMKTLIPAYAQSNALAEIGRVIQEAFKTVEPQKVNLFVHPDQVEPLKFYLQDFEEKNREKVTLTLQTISGVEDFDLSDCRIEWKGGGMERREQRLREEIEHALSRLKACSLSSVEEKQLESFPEEMTESLNLTAGA